VKRGTKPSPPSQQVAWGTYRRDRDLVEVIEPDGLPQRPECLTPEGEEVWMDDVGRVAAHRLVGEKDATAFGTYCNLMGAQIKAWRAGECPPIAAITETRKLQELFGICGARSRLRVASQEPSTNPFSRYGKRRRED
jgi:hypothetical protein